jgi:hypothetical protein
VTVLSQDFILYKGIKLGAFGFCSESYQFFFYKMVSPALFQSKHSAVHIVENIPDNHFNRQRVLRT